ncbi:MAG: type IV pilus assembly protein PilM [Thermoanaerobaculaceae bacterium]|nr:type IV pilus assembly protein PilM [Thermoanaerobaculaceae bacterium]TAM50974.1 MAG: type IV pilus assembly protein PilM [Acidobacteriota bacterium]
MWLGKKKGIVGLDIGSSAIKLVELKAGKSGRFSLLHAGHAPLSPEAIVEGTVMDSSLVVEVAQRLIQEQNVKNPGFGVSLSGISVAIRKISVPAMSEAELAESIHWEAEQYLPFDVNEVKLDYVTLGGDGDTVDVLLVAAKKDRIADYTGILTQLGKVPALVDVDVFALQNAYELNYGEASGKVVALVNIGAHIMNVNILARGASVFWRDIVFGGNAYTEAIQRELNLTREQAEAVKTGEQLGDHTPQTILGVLNGVSEDLAAELQKTFEFFYTTSSHDHVEEIVLAGGACQVLNLDGVLRERLGARVEVMNPFREITYSESQFPPEWLNRHAPSMAVAVGMAMRNAGD